MKRSLGRRSSSRGGPRVTVFNENDGSRIPRRATSTDRNHSSLAAANFQSVSRTPGARMRAGSADRSTLSFLPARPTTAGGGTERPSRATTLSSASSRMSSMGGTRGRTDPRPIEDREWQARTLRKIDDFLRTEEGGCLLTPTGSIRPITLKMFISIVDFLLKKVLFDADYPTLIHKENYITEVPYYMKILSYRGKVEKSWLISVNTTRSWCHVLACLDFLLSLCQQKTSDVVAMMFPAKIEDEDDLWDHKVVLSHLQRCYALYLKDPTNCESVFEQLDEEVVGELTSVDVSKEDLEADIQRISHDLKIKSAELQKFKNILQEKDKIFDELKNQKSHLEENCNLEMYNDFIEKGNQESEELDEAIKTLTEEHERLLEEKGERRKRLSKNSEFQSELEADLKSGQDFLQEQIASEGGYLGQLDQIIRETGLRYLSVKKQIDDMIRKYNLEIMKHQNMGVDMLDVILDSKKSEEEMKNTLEIVQNRISTTKLKLESIKSKCSFKSLEKETKNCEELEKEVNTKREMLAQVMQQFSIQRKEKEDLINKLNEDLESVKQELNDILENPEIMQLTASVAELEIRKNKKDEQLHEKIIPNMKYLISNSVRILDEYTDKFLELDNDFKKALEDILEDNE